MGVYLFPLLLHFAQIAYLLCTNYDTICAFITEPRCRCLTNQSHMRT